MRGRSTNTSFSEIWVSLNLTNLTARSLQISPDLSRSLQISPPNPSLILFMFAGVRRALGNRTVEAPGPQRGYGGKTWLGLVEWQIKWWTNDDKMMINVHIKKKFVLLWFMSKIIIKFTLFHLLLMECLVFIEHNLNQLVTIFYVCIHVTSRCL